MRIEPKDGENYCCLVCYWDNDTSILCSCRHLKISDSAAFHCQFMEGKNLNVISVQIVNNDKKKISTGNFFLNKDVFITVPRS